MGGVPVDVVGQGSPQESAAAYDDLLAQVTGEQTVPESPAPEAPQFDEALMAQVGAAPKPRGWQAAGQYVWEGVQRNFRQIQSAPSTLTAVYHSLNDDPVAEMLAAQRAQEIEAAAPKPQWSLQDVSNPEDFGYWAAERFGENVLTLLTAFAGGATGAVVGALGARALGGSAAARLAAQRAGMLAGGFGTSAPLETAGTAQEQYEVTGSVQPQLSIPAGVAKGFLELYTPAKVLNAFMTPGRQLGRTIAGAVATGAIREGITESMQEAIDIAARMYSDPNYSFFGPGPYLSMGPGAWRLAEAGAAGGLLGGVMGGGTGYVEARQEARAPQGGLLPGEIEVVQEGRAPGQPVTPPDQQTPSGVSGIKGPQLLPTEGVQEYPLSAAIRVGGRTFVAERDPLAESGEYEPVGHLEVRTKAAKENPEDAVLQDALIAQQEEEGFVTNTGRFVSREEASQLALALGLRRIRPQFDSIDLPQVYENIRGGLADNVSAIIDAWHGSPHEFEEFDYTKIGTGEGAQAFMYGLYSAGAQGTGNQYRINLAENNVDKVIIDGKEYTPAKEEMEAAQWLFDNSVRRNMGKVDPVFLNGVIASLQMRGEQNPLERARTAKALAWAEGLRGKKVEFPSKGFLYNVTLDVEPEQLLDWDKLLSQQPKSVQAKLGPAIERAVAIGQAMQAQQEREGVGRREKPAVVDPAKMTGENLYRQLGPKKEASEFLLSLGIPGGQYLDQGSRKKGEGTHNYVVFDDKLMKITKKNGVPVSGKERAAIVAAITRGGKTQQEEAPSVAKPPEAPPVPGTPAEDNMPGPITILRARVEQGKPGQDVMLPEAAVPLPQDDLLGASALLRSGLPPTNVEAYLDFIDANTPRYMIENMDGSFSNEILTDTDLEFATITYPQNVKPKVYLLDQGSLVPAGITAQLDELPPADSRRVWFLPGVDSVTQTILLSRYEVLRAWVNQSRWQMMTDVKGRQDMLAAHRPTYDALLSDGLRVIPSRGSSFLYMGGAPLRAEPSEPPSTTGRAKQWVFMTYEGLLYTGARFEDQLFSNQFAASVTGALPVTIDLNKFKPGEVSLLPIRYAGGKTQYFTYEGVDKGYEAQEAIRAEVELLVPPENESWSVENIRKFREIMKRGIYIDPKKVEIGYSMVTRDPVDPTKLTPAFNVAGMGLWRTMSASQSKDPYTSLSGAEKGLVLSRKLNVIPSEKKTAESLLAALKKLVPTMKSVLKDLGFENGFDVIIRSRDFLSDKEKTSISPGTWAAAWYAKGAIEFYSTPDLWNAPTQELFESKVWQVLAHETGHMVAALYFHKVPVEMQQQLMYAYNKTLLARRSSNQDFESRVTATIETTPMMYSTDYFSSLVEWHAEQFRRFTAADVEVRSEMDRLYSNGARMMEKYYATVEKANPKIAANLLNPDYFFSAYMQYLRDYGKTKQVLRQKERQQALYAVDEDIYSSPASTQILKQVVLALQSMQHMFPKEHPFHLLFNSELKKELGSVEYGAIARTITGIQDKVLMELAVGSLKPNDPQGIYEIFAHELIHVYKYLNLITKEEMNVLYTSAVRDGKSLSSAMKGQLRYQVHQEGERKGWDTAKKEEVYQDVLREETVAYYVGSFAREGAARPEAVPLLERILEVVKRVAAALVGASYHTRDQILEAFFRGEMITRAERARFEEEVAQRFMRTLFEPETVQWDETRQLDDRYEVRIEKNRDINGELNFATYQYYDKQLGKVVAQQEINIKPGRGINVHMQFSDDPKVGGLRGLEYVVRDLGLPLLAPPMFTRSGLRAASRVYPDVKKYYVEGNIDGVTHYYSPKYVKEQMEKWQRIVSGMERMQAEGNTLPQGALRTSQAKLRLAKLMFKKIPKDIWTENKHLLDQLFMLERNYNRDEVQGSMVRAGVRADEAQLESILGDPQGKQNTTDELQLGFQDMMSESQGSAAEKLGIDVNAAAPQDITVRNMRRILSWADRTGARTDPRYVRYLKRVGHDTMVSQEADRIGWFSKMYWGLRQLIWRNEHLTGLQVYGQRVEQYSAVITSWHRDADDIAKFWEQQIREPRMREQFNQFMYWLSEMNYLSAAERAAGTVRHPARTELEAELARRGLNVPQINDLNTGLLWRLYQPPWMKGLTAFPESIFGRFLNEVEQVSVTNITQTISDPALQAAAILEVQAEMNELRAKPYFPITRFGQHSITVRDGDPANNNRVLWFSTYESHTKRDQALAEVKRRFPLDHVHKGRVPEEFLEFLGLPGPLIREVRNNMPNITATQIAWLEELERQNLPDKAFRSRWLPGTGVQGHSMDAFRSFAHYFMHGSRYLARMQFRNPMLQAVNNVEATISTLPNGVKRRMIVDYMKKHYNYLMEGGRDWAKFKSLVSMLQLGFSPAAAFMNLTQTPMVSLPWLQGVFGSSQGQLTKSITAARALRTGSVASGTGNYRMAREEMVRQGRIDIGQAAELGAFAEGNNLLGLLAGTQRQKMYRNFTWASMWMFQKAEQANREILFHAVWELGHKQFKTNARIKEIEQNYFTEISELQARTGMTYEDAVVFVLGKEALDQTQGLYAPYARPTFMRHPVAGTVLIFYQFVQMMTYAFRYNPGQVQMWLMMAFVYGAMGIPGSEDLIKLLRALSVKLGYDLDLEIEARKMVREITRGTIFDEVGPDLFLHGISRYGFGLGLLPDGYAIGQFDASANGSMGKLIPGVAELAHGVSTAKRGDQIVSDVMTRMAGAGFGWFFNLAQFSSESPGTVDGHRWEQMLPRTLRAMAAGYRYLPESLPQIGPFKAQGGATLPSGARLVKFNPTDPEDMAAIVEQFLGFRPTRVTEAMDARRTAVVEPEAIYSARRATLMVQMAAAVLANNAGSQETVMAAIVRFNDEVARDGFGSLAITKQQLDQSLENRNRNRLLQEEFMSQRKMYRPMNEKLMDLFPGVKPQSVR